MEIFEVKGLIVSGSINEWESVTIDIERSGEDCCVLLKRSGFAGFPIIQLNRGAIYLDWIIQRLLNAQALETNNFDDLMGSMCDGTTYSFKIVSKYTSESRHYYCPDESKDHRIHEVCAIIDDVIREYDPPEWEEQRRQFIDEQNRILKQEEDDRRKALDDRKAFAKGFLKELEKLGLKCPHCGKQTKNMKYYESYAYFVCQECGRSSWPEQLCGHT